MYGILSITSSEKTPKNPTFSKEINTCCPASAPHRSEGFFFQGEHDFGPEKMEENNKSRSLHKMKFNIHLYTKNTTMGATYQTKNKKIHG